MTIAFVRKRKPERLIGVHQGCLRKRGTCRIVLEHGLKIDEHSPNHAWFQMITEFFASFAVETDRGAPVVDEHILPGELTNFRRSTPRCEQKQQERIVTFSWQSLPINLRECVGNLLIEERTR